MDYRCVLFKNACCSDFASLGCKPLALDSGTRNMRSTTRALTGSPRPGKTSGKTIWPEPSLHRRRKHATQQTSPGKSVLDKRKQATNAAWKQPNGPQIPGRHGFLAPCLLAMRLFVYGTPGSLVTGERRPAAWCCQI